MALCLALAACAPKSEPPAPPRSLVLDCAQGFDALSARIASAPDVKAAPRTPGEPYVFYNALDGTASYVVTEAGAPGHPAILKQETVRDAAGAKAMKNTGCPFGDPKGYEQLQAYLVSLRAAR